MAGLLEQVRGAVGAILAANALGAEADDQAEQIEQQRALSEQQAPVEVARVCPAGVLAPLLVAGDAGKRGQSARR